MRSKIRDTFGHIHAEKELKDRTKTVLMQELRERKNRTGLGFQRFLLTAASVLVLLMGWGGYQMYYTPMTIISIDINPSLELEINRFDRVISVRGYNHDGYEFVNALHIRHKDYEAALREILASDKVADCLSRDEILSIVVTGKDDKYCGKVLSNLESCISGHNNAYCYQAEHGDVEAAHELGLSCGKYQAFLKIQEINADITSDEVRNMTMREIHEWMDMLSAEHSDENLLGKQAECETGRGDGHGPGRGREASKH